MSTVSVLTLFHGRRDLARSYLEQWRQAEPGAGDVELIFGDCASADGTAALVGAANNIAEVALFPTNLGFSRGNNELAKRAHGEVLLFLNYDVGLVGGWLNPIRTALAGWENLGIVGNVQLSVRARETDHAGMFFDEKGEPFHYRPPLVSLESLSLLPVPAVSGACLAIRRDLFEALGGFDEHYQNGYEDVDLCLRARAAGREIAIATRSVIWHYICSSPGRHRAEGANARRFADRWSTVAANLNCFVPPILPVAISKLRDHPAFSAFQTVQVFFPTDAGYREEESSVHLCPTERWAKIEVPLPPQFSPGNSLLRIDPGWEPGSGTIGGIALYSNSNRTLGWQACGSKLAEIVTPGGTCRFAPDRRGLFFESTGEDPQLLVKLPSGMPNTDAPCSLGIWLRYSGGKTRLSHAGGIRPRHEASSTSNVAPEARTERQSDGESEHRAPAPASPVRVVVDLTRLCPGGQSGGIKPALFAMLRWLAAQNAPPFEFIYLAAPETLQDVASLQRPCDRVLLGTSVPPDLAARELGDVVYCPFGITDFACPGIPTVTLVVDLVHRDFPETLRVPDRIYWETGLAEAVAHTDRFQVISNYTAERLERHYGVPAGQTVCTYQPAHERLCSPACTEHGRTVTQPFFFYPANAWVHKNHRSLLVAYVLYRQIFGPDAWHLVLTGHDDSQMAQVRKLAAALCLHEYVHFGGYVSDLRLTELWNTTGGLVFPSLHEGFGIPLLEAMAHGVPIVAHNGTAIPEVVGQAALLVDARDPVLLAQAMVRFSRDLPLRALLAERGCRRLKDFSVETEFGKLLRLLLDARQVKPRYQRSGFHQADGLTDPVAIFAIPRFDDPVTLDVGLRPLPAERALQIWCGPDLIGTIQCPASRSTAEQFVFQPRSRALTLRVLNAARLSATDPRTHGVLLERLTIGTLKGRSHDLLFAK